MHLFSHQHMILFFLLHIVIHFMFFVFVLSVLPTTSGLFFSFKKKVKKILKKLFCFLKFLFFVCVFRSF
jgi:hypothetical protein